MSARRLTTLAVALLFSTVEVYAFVPQLHGCLPASNRTAAGAAVVVGSTLAAGAGQTRGAAEDCSACRLAGLVMVVQGAIPIAVPLPRVAHIVRPGAASPSSPRLDRACGRAPPLR
jgi:hypothetical protein